MGRIENALCESKKSEKNVTIIGPAIGKTKRIEEWAEENDFDYQMTSVGADIIVYENTDTKQGILVIDGHYSTFTSENKLNTLRKLLNDNDGVIEELFSDYDEIPDILFMVLVLSKYQDEEDVNTQLLDLIKNKDNWSIEKLDFDKTEQLPFFIKDFECRMRLYRDAETERQKRKYMTYERLTKLLKHLEASSNFDTKGNEFRNGVINNTLFYILRFTASSGEGLKENFIEEWKREYPGDESIEVALSDYYDD